MEFLVGIIFAFTYLYILFGFSGDAQYFIRKFNFWRMRKLHKNCYNCIHYNIKTDRCDSWQRVLFDPVAGKTFIPQPKALDIVGTRRCHWKPRTPSDDKKVMPDICPS